jgi:hypothetical protein
VPKCENVWVDAAGINCQALRLITPCDALQLRRVEMWRIQWRWRVLSVRRCVTVLQSKSKSKSKSRSKKHGPITSSDQTVPTVPTLIPSL